MASDVRDRYLVTWFGVNHGLVGTDNDLNDSNERQPLFPSFFLVTTTQSLVLQTPRWRKLLYLLALVKKENIYSYTT